VWPGDFSRYLHIVLATAGPPAGAHRTLRFRGTPLQKHWRTLFWTGRYNPKKNVLVRLLHQFLCHLSRDCRQLSATVAGCCRACTMRLARLWSTSSTAASSMRGRTVDLSSRSLTPKRTMSVWLDARTLCGPPAFRTVSVKLF